MEFKSFEDLFEIPLRNGLTKPKKVRGVGYKMVNMGELFAIPRINNAKMDRVPLTDKEKESSILVDGDLLFARQSLVRKGAGQCSIFIRDEEEVCFESHIIRCRLNKEIANPLFYYYFFRSWKGKQTIDAIIEQGAGASGIRGSDLAKLQVPYIEKDIQDEVAAQLNTIDDKIELNRQINQTLEQIAQTIFKSWFVDFEPVKAKAQVRASAARGRTPESGQNSIDEKELEAEMNRAAMRAFSGKSDEELDQLSPDQLQQLTTTAALFPDELEDDAQGSASAAGGRSPGVTSELGALPKGWEIKPLSQIIELIGGGTPKRSDESYWGGDIPWFSVKDAPTAGDVFVIDTDEKITELGLSKSSTKLLPEGVTIISARGTVGRLALVGVPMAMNQSCYGIKGIGNIGPAFNYFNLKRAISTLKQQTHGAVFDTITTKTFDSVYSVHPCEDSVKEFDRIVTPLLERIKSNLFEIESLSEIRDSLLPKLLSGDLTVSDVAA